MIVNFSLKNEKLSSIRSSSSYDPAMSKSSFSSSRHVALFAKLSMKKLLNNESHGFFFNHSHDKNLKKVLFVLLFLSLQNSGEQRTLSISFLVIVAFLLFFFLSTPSDKRMLRTV